jgi:hypothetical protein
MTDVLLTWENNAANADQTRIERSASGADSWSTVATITYQGVGAGKTHTDTEVPDGLWDYRVFSIQNSVDSLPTNIATIQVGLAYDFYDDFTGPDINDITGRVLPVQPASGVAWANVAAPKWGINADRAFDGSLTAAEAIFDASATSYRITALFSLTGLRTVQVRWQDASNHIYAGFLSDSNDIFIGQRIAGAYSNILDGTPTGEDTQVTPLEVIVTPTTLQVACGSYLSAEFTNTAFAASTRVGIRGGLTAVLCDYFGLELT